MVGREGIEPSRAIVQGSPALQRAAHEARFVGQPSRSRLGQTETSSAPRSRITRQTDLVYGVGEESDLEKEKGPADDRRPLVWRSECRCLPMRPPPAGTSRRSLAGRSGCGFVGLMATGLLSQLPVCAGFRPSTDFRARVLAGQIQSCGHHHRSAAGTTSLSPAGQKSRFDDGPVLYRHRRGFWSANTWLSPWLLAPAFWRTG